MDIVDDFHFSQSEAEDGFFPVRSGHNLRQIYVRM